MRDIHTWVSAFLSAQMFWSKRKKKTKVPALEGKLTWNIKNHGWNSVLVPRKCHAVWSVRNVKVISLQEWEVFLGFVSALLLKLILLFMRSNTARRRHERPIHCSQIRSLPLWAARSHHGRPPSRTGAIRDVGADEWQTGKGDKCNEGRVTAGGNPGCLPEWCF